MEKTSRLVILYAALGAAWIVLSDALLAGETIVLSGQTIKGLGFVAVTSVIFYVLLRRWEGRLRGARRALDESSNMFESVFDRLDDAVFIIGPGRRIVDCNSAVERMLGYRRDELIGKTTEILHVDRTSFEQFAERGDPEISDRGVYQTEGRMRCKNGDAIRTEHTVAFMGDSGTAVSIVRDVTAAREAAESVARQRAHLEALLANVTDIVAVVADDGRYTYFSPSVERVFGYPRDEVVGERYGRLIHADDIPRVDQALARASANPGEVVRVTFRGRHAEGHWVTVEATGVRPIGGAIDGVVVSTRDMSTERALSDKEQQLLQAQKMEAVGRLAGGIAHDFNNILTVILSYSAFLEDALDPKDPRSDDLQAIKEAAEQAARLTKQLLLFSRQQSSEPSVLAVEEVVDRLQKMLTRVLGEDVELELSHAGELPRVYADEGQLGQVLMNLAVNARDAMPTGGTLTIETEPVDIDADHPGKVDREPGRYACIRVTDTGVGMDADTLNYIFEPFFTTKPIGHGTGLGLSTSYGIVTQAGGWIEVDSEPEVGTTFSVFLPAAGVDRHSSEVRAARPLPAAKGETILLVEDDVAVRAAVHRQLTRAGYRVVQVDDPRDALDAASQEEIDLLLTDVVMPGLNGPDLAADLAKTGRCDRVLYMSGYTPDELGGRQLPDLTQDLLRKPFTQHELLDRVRVALAGR